MNAGSRVPLILLAMTIAGVILGYATSIMVARMLGPIGFHGYVVAIAALGLLSSVAEMGAGRQAMKLLPRMRVVQHWDLANGYCRYALLTVFVVSILLAAIVIGWQFLQNDNLDFSPMMVAIIFLPIAAMSGVAIDFVMANHAAIRGTIISRLVVPGTTLLLLCVGSLMNVDVSARLAVVCFGCGSVAGSLLAVRVFWQTSPNEFFDASPSYELKTWTRQCLHFAVFAFLSTSCFRVSILVLEVLPIDDIQVAFMAAAMDTGCLVMLLAKSTDKLYQPLMSVIIEKSDWKSGTELRARRYVLMGTICSGFLITIFLTGKHILRLYGDEFVSAYPSLCLVSVGTSAWTMFSLAPAYLQFRGHSRFVFLVIASSAVSLVILTGVLGRQNGATGASVAFCAVMIATSVAFLIRAVQDLRQIRQADTSNASGL